MKYKGDTITSDYLKRAVRIDAIGAHGAGILQSVTISPVSNAYNTIQVYSKASGEWFNIRLSYNKDTGTITVEDTTNGDVFFVCWLIIDYI